MGPIKRFLIRHRIAAPEYGYPASEARYTSISEWEAATGMNFAEEILKEKTMCSKCHPFDCPCDTPLKLEVGKYYKLENGYKARIDAILPEDSPSHYPVIGVLYSPKHGNTFWNWSRKGGTGNYKIISEWVEPKVPRKGEAWITQSTRDGKISYVGYQDWNPWGEWGKSFKVRWEEVI